MKLPTLYKLTATGATQMWEIEVKGSTIIERWGQLDGKIQSTEDTITVGKNLGKANATSPKEQAEAEAKAKWIKKKDTRGYVENLKRAEKGENDFEGGISPMLAHKFSEHGDKIIYPCYAQPKLDGLRILMDKDGKLWSRTHKPVNSCEHFTTAAKDVQGIKIPLDGEAYADSHSDKFEEIMHLVKQPKYIPECHVIQYHIYDAPISGTFEERYAVLQRVLKYAVHPLVLVETIKVNNEDELMEAFDRYIELGYEGCMARNAHGLYVGKRSYDLLKIKEFDDSEFKCIGAEEGRGKYAGKVAKLICVTKEGKEFYPPLNAPLPALERLWNRRKNIEGKMVTVKYQGLTADGIPRIPKAMRFREDV